MALLPEKPLEKDSLRLCLSAWAKKPDQSAKLTAAETELSEQQVDLAKQWASLGNLFTQRGLTAEGRLALEKDPYLEATVTDWLFHFFGSFSAQRLQPQPQNFSDWCVWPYFIYRFLLENPAFTQNGLLQAVSQNLSQITSMQQVNALLATYTSQNAIASCRFLSKSESIYAIGNPNLENAYTVAYLLAAIWQRDFGKQQSVLVDDILSSSMGLPLILGLDESQTREQLNRLAELEIIEQRSARPYSAGGRPERRQSQETSYIAVRCWENPLELLEQAYENDAATPNRPLIQALDGILDDDNDGELPFLSSVQHWMSNLRPQQPQLFGKRAAIAPPLHLAG